MSTIERTIETARDAAGELVDLASTAAAGFESPAHVAAGATGAAARRFGPRLLIGLLVFVGAGLVAGVIVRRLTADDAPADDAERTDSMSMPEPVAV